MFVEEWSRMVLNLCKHMEGSHRGAHAEVYIDNSSCSDKNCQRF